MEGRAEAHADRRPAQPREAAADPLLPPRADRDDRDAAARRGRPRRSAALERARRAAPALGPDADDRRPRGARRAPCSSAAVSPSPRLTQIAFPRSAMNHSSQGQARSSSVAITIVGRSISVSRSGHVGHAQVVGGEDEAAVRGQVLAAPRRRRARPCGCRAETARRAGRCARDPARVVEGGVVGRRAVRRGRRPGSGAAGASPTPARPGAAAGATSAGGGAPASGAATSSASRPASRRSRPEQAHDGELDAELVLQHGHQLDRDQRVEAHLDERAVGLDALGRRSRARGRCGACR